jgi:hypothetical protein
MMRRIFAWLRGLFVSRQPVEPEPPPRRPEMMQPLEERQFLSVAVAGLEREAVPVPAPPAMLIPLGAVRERGDIAGKWKGTVKALGERIPIVLRITSTSDGIIRGKVKSPKYDDGWYRFKVKGAISTDGIIVATYKDNALGIRAKIAGQVTPDGERATGLFKVTEDDQTIKGKFELKRIG